MEPGNRGDAKGYLGFLEKGTSQMRRVLRPHLTSSCMCDLPSCTLMPGRLVDNRDSRASGRCWILMQRWKMTFSLPALEEDRKKQGSDRFDMFLLCLHTHFISVAGEESHRILLVEKWIGVATTDGLPVKIMWHLISLSLSSQRVLSKKTTF